MSYNLSSHAPTDVTIRYATEADAPALARLAALDSQALPEGDLLVAEVGGELWAAVSVIAGGGIADPFRRSADVRALLEARARQLGGRPDAQRAFAPAAWLRGAVLG